MHVNRSYNGYTAYFNINSRRAAPQESSTPVGNNIDPLVPFSMPFVDKFFVSPRGIFFPLDQDAHGLRKPGSHLGIGWEGFGLISCTAFHSTDLPWLPLIGIEHQG